MANKTFFLGLFGRREIIAPTGRGLLVMVILLGALAYGFMHKVYPFLSPNDPVRGEILIVEGWIPDYSWAEALATFRSKGYRLMLTTGGPLPAGMPYSYFGTYAALSAQAFKNMGLGPDSVLSIPSEDAKRDRTYAAGEAVSKWLKAQGQNPTQAKFIFNETSPSLDLFTFSAHGRRSRYLYRKAMQTELGISSEESAQRLGVYSTGDIGFDQNRWWISSNGVRRITDEFTAYLYSILIFSPRKD